MGFHQAVLSFSISLIFLLFLSNTVGEMWSFTQPFRTMSRLVQAAAFGEPCKMVLVVRKDLQMGVGKVAAQCSHAAVGAVDMIRSGMSANGANEDVQARIELHQRWLDAWFVMGSAKIVVQAQSENELNEIQNRAQAAGIPSFLVEDAGRTQVASGTRTVLSVGPGPKSQVDALTGHLKLL